MNVLSRLDAWKDAGAISAAQHDAIRAIERRDRFSIFLELNLLLYAGVMAVAAGVGWTATTYSARLGDVAILATLTCACGASLYYCFTRTPPYSHDAVDAPGPAFDYVLYLGCLLFAVELGYIEWRFQPFSLDWDHLLLVASVVFFALAYRFDNPLVLSLALSSLGGWFGVRVSRLGLLFGGTLREWALIYGTLVAVAGAALHHAGIKKHFLEIYLHLAAHVLFIALLTGVAVDTGWPVYLAALLALTTFAVFRGVRYNRFAYLVYGVVYGYLGVSTRVVREFHGVEGMLAYLVVSGTVVIVSLVVVARRFGRAA